MAKRDNLPSTSSRAEVDAFLRKVAVTPAAKPAGRPGRLIFALDATASRQPTWDQASQIQAEMFRETAALGGLEIQLVHYGGFGEFNASPWLTRSSDLLARMAAVSCRSGPTQIGKLLRHALGETRRAKVDAVVFVGDCMEENIERLADLAGRLGLLGVPVFLFHEGRDAEAARAFREIARLTNGAYCRFDSQSAQQLRDLLGAVAVYAAGGRPALEDYGRRRGGTVLQITHQLARK
jgi:hypothetical protein